jgi:hypothetical protein
MLQVLVVISQKFCCREETCGYAKVIHKKREKEKNWKKWKVSKISKIIGTQMPARKKRRDE